MEKKDKTYTRTVVLTEEQVKFFDKIKFKKWFFDVFFKSQILKEQYRIDAEDVLEDKINDMRKKDNNQ